MRRRTNSCAREKDGGENASDKGDDGVKLDKEVAALAKDIEKPRERATGFSGDVYSGRPSKQLVSHQTPVAPSHYASCTGAAAARENLAREVIPQATSIAAQPGCCIFVGHLPPRMSEAAVMQTFQMFGKVVAVKIFPQESYCLAQFTNPLDAQVAVNMMHKKTWLGETLNVKISHHPFVRL